MISGHLDLTQEEFQEHYIPQINRAIRNGDSFVVGDARGTDARFISYMMDIEGKVLVFHMFESPRNNDGFPTVGGFISDEERDQAMTAFSNYDIAWVRPGKENSGTAKNLARRAAKNNPEGRDFSTDESAVASLYLDRDTALRYGLELTNDEDSE